MELKLKIRITIVTFIILILLQSFYDSLKYIAILDIVLIYSIAFVFPFFGFRDNSPMGIPALIFFLINVSILGKSIITLGFFFDNNYILLGWITKSLVMLIYVLILAINKKSAAIKK